MKILRVLPSMGIGGIEKSVYDFTIEALSLGHKVVIASGPGELLPFLHSKGAILYNLPMDKKNPAVFIRSVKRLRKLIEQETPDIIHTESRFPCWVVHYARKYFPEIPVVTSIHNFYSRRLYSQPTGKGDIVITVSEALKEYAVEYLKAPKEKIRVVYNGVEEDFLNIEKVASSVVRVGMIARFTTWKGHFYLLKALKKLNKEGIKFQGLIIGAGSSRYKSKLERWIKTNGLTDIIGVRQMDAKEALKHIDILVAPSIQPEGFGRTVIEAQMSKTPVIGTNIGAIPELIKDGETGFLVSPHSADMIAEKIKKLIEDASLFRQISEKAQKSALQKFSLQKIVSDTFDVYNELLEQR
ncbi:MAG: glycosyltransferase family 4 protein [Candidatus Ratteibacteria bacterium]